MWFEEICMAFRGSEPQGDCCGMNLGPRRIERDPAGVASIKHPLPPYNTPLPSYSHSLLLSHLTPNIQQTPPTRPKCASADLTTSWVHRNAFALSRQFAKQNYFFLSYSLLFIHFEHSFACYWANGKPNEAIETKRHERNEEKKNCHRLFLEAKWKYILNSDSKMRVVCYLYTDSDNSFTKRLCIGRRLRRLRRLCRRRRLLLILQRIIAVCPRDSCLFVQRRYPNNSVWSSFMLPKAPKSISSIFRPLDAIREINIPLRIAKQTQIRRKQKIDETLLFVCTELCWTTSISNAKHFRPFV